MTPTRRRFLRSAALGTAGAALGGAPLDAATPGGPLHAATPGDPPCDARLGPGPAPALPQDAGDRYDPWIEVDAGAFAHNVGEVRRLSGGRPVLAVVKNNAYGLDVTKAAAILEPMPEIAGFAVVKAEAAIALRDAGIRKPVYLMALFAESMAPELARRRIVPCLYSDDSPRLVDAMARAAGGPIGVQVYVDTGMSRMGIPWRDALPWIEALVRGGSARVAGVFTGFTEDPEYDRVQLDRFTSLAREAAAAGFPLGVRHAASSSAVFELPQAHLDMVRPGMALYGGYPNDPALQRDKASLRSTARLRARVVRVQRLEAGDSVSYGRNYVAGEPTWVATLPVGHTDGYPRSAVSGGRVLIGSRSYPVIGAVSASHTIVEVGAERTVEVGDVATLIGPDHADVDPNRLSEETGVSIYDVFMHLNPTLPRVVV